MEAPLLGVVAILWISWVLISVDDIPLLVKLSGFLPDGSGVVLVISLSSQYLSSDVDEVHSLELPHLPPS